MKKIYRQAVALLTGLICLSFSGFAEDDDEPISFGFALYYSPEPSNDPEAESKRLIEESYPEFLDIGAVTVNWLPIADYSPPDSTSFQYMSVDLDSSLAPKLAEAPRVFVLSFESTPENCTEVNRFACSIVADLAEKTDGYPWDEECRLLYSQNAWRNKKVNTWQESVPDMREQINMHAYRNPDLVRIITLGMRKFNLPDLEMTDVFSGSSRSAGNTVNYLAQHLVENGIGKSSQFSLKLAKLKHENVRDDALSNPLEGAKGQVAVELVEGSWEEGDPYNIIAKVTFPEIEAESPTESQSIAFSTLYGSTDEIQQIRSGDAKIAAASALALKKFLSLKPHFDTGLEPNERMVVKYGFPANGSKEFMWIEVLKWEEGAIQGILLNDSYYDEDLREGKRVSIPVSEIFDYIHYKPDGTAEGNETGKLIQQMQGN